MIELGELEKNHAEFAKRNTRVVVVSIEGREDAEKTRAQFPHLTVVADDKRSLAKAVDLIHVNSNPNGGDTTAPTTILIDRKGDVKWLYRSERVITRLSPEELLAAVDKYLGTH
jgi:peroxiredoxin